MSTLQDGNGNGKVNVDVLDAPTLTSKKGVFTVPVAQNPSNVGVPFKTDASGNLKVTSSGATVTEGGAIGTDGTPIVGEDDSGNAKFPKVRSNGTMRAEMLPYLYNIVEGNVPNHTLLKKHSRAVIATTARTLLVRGTWAEQASGAQRSFASSSANDAAAGTGVRKIEVKYISSTDGLEKSEVVTLNGLTAVDTTATDIKWINSIESISAGSGKYADGTISMYDTTGGGGSIMAQISVGHTELHSSVYYVPTGKTLFVTRVERSSDNKGWFEVESTVDFTGIGGGANTPHSELETYSEKGSGQSDLSAPLRIEADQKIETYVEPDDAGDEMGIQYFGWLE